MFHNHNIETSLSGTGAQSFYPFEFTPTYAVLFMFFFALTQKRTKKSQGKAQSLRVSLPSRASPSVTAYFFIVLLRDAKSLPVRNKANMAHFVSPNPKLPSQVSL